MHNITAYTESGNVSITFVSEMFYIQTLILHPHILTTYCICIGYSHPMEN